MLLFRAWRTASHSPMSRPKQTSGKRAREAARKDRARVKAERRTERQSQADDSQGITPSGSESELLDQLAALHQSYRDGAVGFDELEEQQATLREQLGRLPH
jgi:hypothetical protein